MLSETDARRLLHLAAESVPVAAATAQPPRPQRRQRHLIALGTALAVAATVAVVFLLPGGDRRPEPTSPSSPEPPGVTLDANQIPSVFAMTGDQARQLVADRGLSATVRQEPTCAEVAGRALRTVPATGTRFRPGDRVTVLVASTPAAAACKSLKDRALAWQLLDWANGRGQPPAFADRVSSFTNGEDPVAFDPTEAADPAAWGSDAAPAALARRSGEIMTLTSNRRTEYRTPALGVVTDDGRDFVCGGWDLPGSLDHRRSIMVSVGVPTDGFADDCTMVNLFVTDGQIDTVVLRQSEPADVGRPNGQSAEPESVEVREEAEQVGEAFVSFARDNGASDDLFAAEVDLWLGNRPIATIDAASATTESAWNICPPEGDGYAEAVCPFSALEAVRESKWPLIYLTQHPLLGACAAGSSDTELPGGPFVVLGVAEPDACMNNWNVELYYGADRRITAVNLLLGAP
ncbi:PASTA domain-containing protein [Nocardioides speluncae]|uniref:PASTA domain-containing protein n=1 Tax=Nocardioides speluncae TaxID=2670337 RepID=UPI000D68772B|nr:PASTA domain-containing protein [Nocardioides speluncae]